MSTPIGSSTSSSAWYDQQSQDSQQSDQSQSNQQPDQSESPQPSPQSGQAEQIQQSETPEQTEPAQQTQPSQQSEPAQQTQPAQQTEPVRQTQPSQQTEPAQQTHPTEQARQPAPSPTPAPVNGAVSTQAAPPPAHSTAQTTNDATLSPTEAKPQSQLSQPSQPTGQVRQPASSPTPAPTNGAASEQAVSPLAPPTAQTTNSPAISPAEAKNLIDRYENDQGYPNDSQNGAALADLQADSLRGMPNDDIQFETRQTLNRQKIEALPQKERDRYTGIEAMGVNTYESVTSTEDRQKVAQAMDKNVTQPVNTAYGDVMASPQQRIPLEFKAPFGTPYLGSSGQQQAASLQQLGIQFNQAATPQTREQIFEKAAEIRHNMQLQIQARVAQAKAQTDQQWVAADKELYAAQDYAKSMQIMTLGDLDNTAPFERLNTFAQKAFTSQRNAQELQYLMQTQPDKFKDLKSWSDDATTKTEWARNALLSDPFHRTPNLPPSLPDYMHVPTDDLHMGNYGPELQDRFQLADKIVAEDEKMYHAASQHGPIKYEYLDAHTPPKPLWQQQTEDVLGRFFVGLIPGVNIINAFTGLIVPANSLSPEAKEGVDFLSGVLGGMLGEAKIPSFRSSRAGNEKLGGGKTGEAGDGKTGEDGGAKTGEGEGSKTGEGGGNKTGEGGSGSSSAGAPGDPSKNGAGSQPAGNTPSNIPLVSADYVSRPSGALAPDPQFRGIYRDSNNNAYIQQNGQTFAVKYQPDQYTWAVQAPDSLNAAPYPVRLNGDGNWEPNTVLRLKGGGSPEYTSLPGGGRTMYTDAKGRTAYQSYEDGANYREIGRQLGVAPTSVKNWIDRYAREHGFEKPYKVASRLEINWMSDATGKSIYTDVSNGTPLQDVANKYTDGNVRAAYRSGMRYARNNKSSYQPMLDSKIKQAPPQATPEPAPGEAPSTSAQPQADYMTSEQYEAIQKFFDEARLSPKEIAQQTGVPEPWVEDVEHGYGYWSPSQQAYVEPIFDPTRPVKRPAEGPSGSGQPPKQPRTDSSPQPQAGPAPKGPGWGRNEVRQYLAANEETMKNFPEEFRDSIYRWFEGEEPAPPGLQQEMIDQGFPSLTPEMVRGYLNGVKFTPGQTDQIVRWLDLAGIA